MLQLGEIQVKNSARTVAAQLGAHVPGEVAHAFASHRRGNRHHQPFVRAGALVLEKAVRQALVRQSGMVLILSYQMSHLVELSNR